MSLPTARDRVTTRREAPRSPAGEPYANPAPRDQPRPPPRHRVPAAAHARGDARRASRATTSSSAPTRPGTASARCWPRIATEVAPTSSASPTPGTASPRRDGRRGASRRATERELRVLRAHLEASLLEDDAPLSDLAAARAEHDGLVRAERSATTPAERQSAAGAAGASRPTRRSRAATARDGRPPGTGSPVGARQPAGMVVEPAGAPLRRLRAAARATSRMSPRRVAGREPVAAGAQSRG